MNWRGADVYKCLLVVAVDDCARIYYMFIFIWTVEMG